jgi:2-polyprenyl-3-methyl-5-hydroxy-6-metoxy-1,4-benzoquinol methylase
MLIARRTTRVGQKGTPATPDTQSDTMRRIWQETAKVTLRSSLEERSLEHVGRFTQPDCSVNPNYFIEFLDIVNCIPEMKKVRARSFGQMRIGLGSSVLDVGCGVGTAVAR